ncbi:hypothetical protein DS2_02880 [Catenovulum agarivorans DS-2]|uniref:ASPIC/UnbV domain-containing protein n=1 Tax=Catenovulum agarivorans DS-2 TaxID=1328313 RepID=W7QVI3_9ALTE|nr:CRTAC1 family protein [Catenovulum agarivorans]EWH11733.1 hypothetical protein DS2_02880 [Catenovulum agarivorans DS-2]
MIRLNKAALATLSALTLLQFSCSSTNEVSQENKKVTFEDVSNQVGLVTEANWKYGGPSIADLNHDGHYDLLLTNHNTTPIELFMANGDGTYRKNENIYPRVDLHGIASGDYDLDGDQDVLISLGGGNGKKPQPQRLLRNDNGKFVDVTVEAGLSEMGARGRAVRWIDIDLDGDLDFMQINAEKMISEEVPRNILFENLGNGKFVYRSSPEFEEIDAERVLITDLNNDGVSDLIAFNAYSKTTVWQGNKDFHYTDVTQKVLPQTADGYHGVLTVAQADIDNDGDLDYYFARGKLYYTIANNAISFNPQTGRLDLRDEGNKSQDGFTLHAHGDLTLTDFSHFPRARRMEYMPVYLGKTKQQITTPAEAISISQQQAQGFPEEINETGWYIGYVGNGNWRVEWKLTDDLAWDIRASFIGVESYDAEWKPQELGLPDALLRNDGGKLVDISSNLPSIAQDNNWGVVTGDFNNDTFADFFLYRFGELKERVADALLINQGNNQFNLQMQHGADTEIGMDSHGDMGAAFDYNFDGKLDLLSGDDDNGRWHLYQNTSDLADNNYLSLRIGYSPKGTDPLGAKVTVVTKDASQFQLVGSHSASHSQSVTNICHFGLAQADMVEEVTIQWRDGSQQKLQQVAANQLKIVGHFPK